MQEDFRQRVKEFHKSARTFTSFEQSFDHKLNDCNVVLGQNSAFKCKAVDFVNIKLADKSSVRR